MEKIHLILVMMLCFGVHRSSSETLQRQKRNWIIGTFSIDEGYEGPFPYSLGIIKVEKDLSLFKIHGQGVDINPKGVLEINKDTGEVKVYRSVDYEDFKMLQLTFQAFDREKNVIDTQLGIRIDIIDSNDNPPKFDRERYEVSIKESTSQGTEVITVKASDIDSMSNGIFDLRIISVTPKPHDVEFYLTEITRTQTGTISFKGCLDHEQAEKYIIIVEAKDHGEKKQLSSSCTIIINIEDGNNHLPTITGQTGPGRVKEGAENVLVSRLQVTDEDSKGTAAWRAKYQIQGDTNNNFRITTDPETNEGLLYVKKHLDYEESPLKNMIISVENEIPSHTCKVVSRTTTGLWEVVTNSGGETESERLGSSTHRVTVTVEDVNEVPVFDKPNIHVMLGENVEPGKYLGTLTARDPDITSANLFEYIKGEDPAHWVMVDPVTGNITSSKLVDRESLFVKDNIYKVTIYAVDNGKPQMTGTTTLNLHIIDANDNTPSLEVSTIDMCQSDGPSLANLTASDLDTDPYGGPFTFKLLGDVKGKWSVDPEQGYSVNLVKENSVHSGHFELLLQLSDLQGETAVHSLSVTVCNCLDTAMPNCRMRKATGTAVGGGALGIILCALLLFAGAMLLAFLVSCRKQIIEIPDGLDSGQCLMMCNTEIAGTDCQVPFELLIQGHSQYGEQMQTISKVPTVTLQKSFGNTTTAAVQQAYSEYAISQTEQQRRNLHSVPFEPLNQGHSQYGEQMQTISKVPTVTLQQSFGNTTTAAVQQAYSEYAISQTEQQRRNLHSVPFEPLIQGHSQYGEQMQTISNVPTVTLQQRWGFIDLMLNMMLNNLEAPGEELGDYAPHVYAEEDDTDIYEFELELDAFPICDISFDPNLDLDFKFNTLAAICMSGESTA